MNAALTLENVSKAYGKSLALDCVSITLEPGVIYALLGPNGAGKTTLLSIAAGLAAPSAGRVGIAGFDMATQELEAKGQLGFLPDTPYLYDHLSGAEMLNMAGLLYGLPLADRVARAHALLSRLDLADREHQPVGAYSHGMRKRLALACCLLHRPRLLVLDEPTNGLDLGQARSCRDLIVDHAEEGGAVLVSTHQVDLVARICHRVGILKGGRLIMEGSPDELCRQLGTPDLEEMYFRAVAGAQKA